MELSANGTKLRFEYILSNENIFLFFNAHMNKEFFFIYINRELFAHFNFIPLWAKVQKKKGKEKKNKINYDRDLLDSRVSIYFECKKVSFLINGT